MIKDEPPELKIIYKGLFDFDVLYKAMRQYLQAEGFQPATYPEDGIALYDTAWLSYYLEKGDPTRYVIRWNTKMDLGKYWRYLIDITINTVAVTRVEVPYEGKKEKMFSGEIEIILKSTVLGDYKDEWSKHWLLKNFQHKYEKRMMKKDLDVHEENVLFYMNQLAGVIRSYLKQTTEQIPGNIAEKIRSD